MPKQTDVQHRMAAEAKRRGWNMPGTRLPGICKLHGCALTAISQNDYVCDPCLEEAMAWQLSLRTSHVDIAKIPDAQRSESFAERLDYFADPERRRAARRAAASATDKRAAAVRSGKKAAKNAESRPRCAKKSELRIWTE